MRDVKIAYANGWKRSKIVRDKGTGFYSGCTVSLLKQVPDEVSNAELIERWDGVCLTRPGELRYVFHYYELLDAETIARDTYKCEEHNKHNGPNKHIKI